MWPLEKAEAMSTVLINRSELITNLRGGVQSKVVAHLSLPGSGCASCRKAGWTGAPCFDFIFPASPVNPSALFTGKQGNDRLDAKTLRNR